MEKEQNDEDVILTEADRELLEDLKVEQDELCKHG